MQCSFYTKNGMVLKSTGDVDRNIFNNPDVVKAEFEHSGHTFSFILTEGKRLIFYKEHTMNSPLKTTYCVGYQQKLKGRSHKIIIKINPEGNVELI